MTTIATGAGVRLDLGDIQGNILRPYHHRAATYLFWRVNDPVSARLWLGEVAEQVTTAAATPGDVSLNLALTWRGLRALGVGSALLAALPEPFRQGMAARAGQHLGDHGPNAPERWEPPFRESDDLHVVVIVTGARAAVDARVAELRTDLWQSQMSEAGPALATDALPADREHFGFRDGLSQPWVEGVEKPKTAWGSATPAGEFVLGLPDLDGAVQRAAAAITHHGSYLVVRKLAQDVAGYRRRLAEAARSLDAAEGLVAAKMMGRWPDGTPVTESPEGPWTADDADDPRREESNGFDYAVDPGERCPVGSHIRRANPRGSLSFSGHLENRHRILRRGMPYGPAYGEDTEDADRGLLFACYQADIADQFEFVQAQWLGDGNVFALGNDRDPFVGDPDGSSGYVRFEAGRGSPPPAPRFVPALQDTVVVRGGEYLLVPGISALRHLASTGAEGWGRR